MRLRTANNLHQRRTANSAPVYRGLWAYPDISRALPYLVQLRKAVPENYGARLKLSTALSEVGRVDDARKEGLARAQFSNEVLASLLVDVTVRDRAGFDRAPQLAHRGDR